MTEHIMKIVVAGPCITGDCGCIAHDKKKPTDSNHLSPPFHDGCTCYMIEYDPVALAQPKPGRALDVRMARVMGWEIKEPFAYWGDKFPFAVPLSDLGNKMRAWIYDAPDRAREWSPSTQIADAFEVMDKIKGAWRFEELGPHLSVGLSMSHFTTSRLITLEDFVSPDGTRNRPEAYAFGICWAVWVWLERQKEG